jgi:predicted tellurium resistance membrane protein TerC
MGELHPRIQGCADHAVELGVAANVVARLLQKHRWIAYVGLAIILYVACDMIYRGAYELKPVMRAVVALV